MISQKEAIMKSLFHIARKYEKAYCYPSQIRILNLIRKHYGVRRSLRTLNRRLAEMQREGFFTRTRRHRRGKDNKMVFNTTLYRIGGKAFNWLYGMGTLAKHFFSFYHVPKMARYKSNTASDLSKGGSLGSLNSFLGPIGRPSATNSLGQKIFL